MEPGGYSDYVTNEWAFEARNRIMRPSFSLLRQEREESNIHPNYDANWDEEGGYFLGIPASSKAIVGLHMPVEGETKEKNCVVCLDDFKEGDKLRMMPCSHSIFINNVYLTGSVLAVFARAAGSLCPPSTSNTFWINQQHVYLTKLMAADIVARFSYGRYAGQFIVTRRCLYFQNIIIIRLHSAAW